MTCVGIWSSVHRFVPFRDLDEGIIVIYCRRCGAVKDLREAAD